jgi:plasmid replication initiation protein
VARLAGSQTTTASSRPAPPGQGADGSGSHAARVGQGAGSGHDRQLDLFIPYIADLPLRDTRETMERPFFSLAKRKRLKPIEYTSPDGTIYVKVFATPQFGMAPIWDADILIWASSTLNALRNSGCNDLPRTLNFQAYDVLKTIGRDTGGRDYHSCATHSAGCRRPP